MDIVIIKNKGQTTQAHDALDLAALVSQDLGNALDVRGDTLYVPTPAAGQTIAVSSDVPDTTNTADIPTQMVGTRTMNMGEPDAWGEVTIGVETYFLPLYNKL